MQCDTLSWITYTAVFGQGYGTNCGVWVKDMERIVVLLGNILNAIP